MFWIDNKKFDFDHVVSDSLIEGIIKKGVLMMNSKEEGEHSNIVNC